MAAVGLVCSNCKASLSLPAGTTASRVKCPKCQAIVVVPTTMPTVPDIAQQSRAEQQTHDFSDPMLESQSSGDVPDVSPPILRPSQKPDELGRLGHFRVLSELGKGGMGIVYLAEDISLQRPVALKVMLPQYAAMSQAKSRFLREARAAAKIENDHIITIHEVSEDNGVPFLAMPVLKGEPLNVRLKRDTRLPLGDILRIGAEICDGLNAAHERGLVHRDLKPANIWLEGTRARVKILDFGLARPVASDEHLTKSGVVLGTPAYMSPEQARNPNVDFRADLFSLGVMLYQMATGKLPFIGHDTLSTLYSICNDEPAAPSSLHADLPGELNALILKLLDKDPAKRFESAEHAGLALGAINNKYVAASRTGTDVASVPIAKPVAPRPKTPAAPDSLVSLSSLEIPNRPKPTPPRRPLNKKLIAAVFFGFFALLLGGGIVIRITYPDGTKKDVPFPERAKFEILIDKKLGIIPPVDKKDPAPDADLPAPNYAGERKAAEFALANNGTIRVEFNDNHVRLGPGEELPNEPFVLTQLEFHGQPLTDEVLGVFSKCTRLRALTISGAKISDEGFAHFRNVTTFTNVTIQDCGSLGIETAKILSRSKNLRNLRAWGTQLGDDWLALLRPCKRLEVLECPFELITDTGLEHLRSFQHLRFTDCLTRQNLTSNGIKSLSEIGSLTDIGIQQPDDALIDQLGVLRKKLIRLELHSPTLSEDGYEKIAKHFSLKELQTIENVGGNPPSDKSLKSLAMLFTLERLRIALGETPHKISSQAIKEFRRQRPDVALEITSGKAVLAHFQRLVSWPEAPNGGLAEWNLPKEAPPPAVMPFSVDDAKKHQRVWAEYQKKPVEIENSIGMKLRLIPPGEFVFHRDGRGDELVRFDKPFAIADTEVTREQFQKFVDATEYKTAAEVRKIGRDMYWKEANKPSNPERNWKNPEHNLGPDRPVTVVLPEDMNAFCAWLSKQDGAVYRLPTEEEWEFAARAGDEWPRSFLREKETWGEYGWFSDQLPKGDVGPQPVRTKKANPFGLFDIAGNVHECCTRGSLQTLVRGDAWNIAESHTSLSHKWHLNDPTAQSNVGFRIVRQYDGPLPRPLEKPILVHRGQPLSFHAYVSTPPKIGGLRSWSIELAGQNGQVVKGLAWSPKGDWLVTGGTDDSTVRIWNPTLKLKQVLLGHEGGVRQVSVSSDCKWIASSDDNSVRLWDSETGSCRAVIPVPASWIGQIAFSTGELRLSIVTGAGLFVFNVSNGELMRLSGASMALAWSPDGSSIVVGDDAERLKIVNLKTLEAKFLVVPDWQKGDKRAFYSATWSPDGKWIAAGASDMTIRIWEVETLRYVREIPANTQDIVAWHLDSRRLATNPAIFDATTGKKIVELEQAHGSGPVAWSPDGSRLALMTNELTLRLFDETGKVVASADRRGYHDCTHWDRTQWSFSANGEKIVFRGRGPLLTFDSNGTLQATRKDLAVSYLSRNGDWGVVDRDGEYLLTPIHKATKPLTLGLKSGSVKKFESDRSGRRLAAVMGQSVAIFDTATGAKISELAHPKSEVRVISWSLDGRQLMTAADDVKLRIWDAEKATLLKTLDQLPHGLPVRLTRDWDSGSPGIWISSQDHQISFLILQTTRFKAPEDIAFASKADDLLSWPGGDRFLIRAEYNRTYVCDAESNRPHFLGSQMGASPEWMPDGRRFLGDAIGLRAFDVVTRRRMGSLIPLEEGHWICIGPDGHYRGSEGVEEHIVYVAQTDEGHNITLTPAEFQQRFGWKNDPAKARLLGWAP